jgi:HK97 family phage major capsid protein
MKILDNLRADQKALLEQRAEALAAMEAATPDEARSLTDEETTSFDEAHGKLRGIDEKLTPLEERIGELEAVEKRTAEVAKIPAVHFQRREDPADILEDRNATATQLADALTRSLEPHISGEQLDHARKLAKRHAKDKAWARNLMIRSTDVYAEAWIKVMRGDALALTDEERAAIQVGSNTAGGYLVPTYLDPTVIITNAGVSNVIRGISRVVTLTTGNVWTGVSSAGVTASWDGEVVEVSDDTPTFGKLSIPVYKAQAFVQASIEAFEDISGLTDDVAMLLADGKDQLEAAAHATGAGSTQPRGIFTALLANTGRQVVSTTAATIGLPDLDATYIKPGVRFRQNGTWLMNPKYALAIKDLGTAVSASFSGDLTQAPSDRILGKGVVESDEAPTTQTTTVKDAEIAFGNFQNYVIVDKPGSTAVEFIPQLFNTANNLPDGRKGWYMHWRTGADSVNDNAFALLVDKTSA